MVRLGASKNVSLRDTCIAHNTHAHVWIFVEGIAIAFEVGP
jgi:hypothetical protein